MLTEISFIFFLVSFNPQSELKESFRTKEILDLSYGVSIGIASSALISTVDLRLRNEIVNENTKKLGKILSIPGEAWFLLPLCILGYTSGALLRSPQTRIIFLRSLVTLGITTSVVQILKFLGRYRTYQSPENQWRFSPLGLEDWRRSFPSGHSQASASVYFTISNICKNKVCKYAIISIPFIVATGRVLADEHWLSDTVGGIIIGGSFEIF